MNKLKSLSVFFPAYNEEDNIARTVENAFRIIPAFAEKSEVIVINDGSKDQTGEKLKALVKRHPSLRIITHPVNRGYGAALKSGLTNAQYDYVFYSDGDGQFELEEIARLILLIKNCDIAAGVRVNRNDPFYRIVNAKAYNLLVRLLFGLKVRDIDCAFKLIKKAVIEKISLESESQFISAEFLIKAKKKGFRLLQCGVTHLPRQKGNPTGNSAKAIINSFKELFKLWKNLRSKPA